MPELKLVMFCPQCYSQDLKSVQPIIKSRAVHHVLECANCGYRGTFPEGDPVDIPPIREVPKAVARDATKTRPFPLMGVIIPAIFILLFAYGFFWTELLYAKMILFVAIAIFSYLLVTSLTKR